MENSIVITYYQRSDTMDVPDIRLWGTILDCSDPKALSVFYLKLLKGWERTYADKTFVFIDPPGGGASIGFQRDPLYEPPVWPGKVGEQQQCAHLDFLVAKADYAKAVEHAVQCGARVSPVQHYKAKLTVLTDPEGHPFCIIKDAYS